MSDTERPTPEVALTLDRLPAGLDVLWNRRERGRTGPRPALTVEGIVEQAIRIADAEGLAAVSMARLARELGFSTMSLYRYVRSRDELHVLMWNSGAAGMTIAGGGTWREQLTDWSMTQYRELLRRPWLLELVVAAPPAGPASIAFVELAVQALWDTPLRPTEKMGIVGALSMYALADARMAHATLVAPAGSEEPLADYAVVLRTVVDPAEHPALHELSWSAEMTAPLPPEMGASSAEMAAEGFRFAVDLMLDGVEALIRRREAGA